MEKIIVKRKNPTAFATVHVGNGYVFQRDQPVTVSEPAAIAYFRAHADEFTIVEPEKRTKAKPEPKVEKPVVKAKPKKKTKKKTR